MTAKKKSGGTAAVVRRLAEPIAAELGLSIWDVRFVKEGADWFLRIFIDKPEGIGIEDCEAMSRAVNGPLDELDPIDQAYCLEVCSPGIGRELTRDEHFAAFLGSPVEIRMIRPLEDGRRNFTAVLTAFSDGVMTLDRDGETVAVPQKDAASVRLWDENFGGIEE